LNGAQDFWSRRKAQVEAEARAEAREAEAAEQSLRDADLAERPESEILEALNLPDPDTLGLGDDFKAFMSREVPERIRRRALRRLWVSNPVLANLDGLLDYAGDFTDKACVVENMKTAYQVGKGMLAHVEEMARQAARESDPAAVDIAESEGEEVAETEEAGEPLAEDTLAEIGRHPEAESPEAFASVDDGPFAPPRRRMSFRFQDHAEVTA
jgi:hypothetical protein